MRAFRRAVAIVGLVGAMVLAPSAATAAGNPHVTTLNVKGPLVNATFSHTSGCVETDVFVTANNQIARQSVEGFSNGLASVSIVQGDLCTGALLLLASGEQTTLQPGELVISNQLDQATLSATIPVVDDVSGKAFPVTVDLTWVGTSAIFRNRSFSNDLLGGRCRVIDHWKGTGRDATAFGSVSDGTVDYTPTGSEAAEIGDVITGSVVVQCS